jgi:predicted TIM-barrel fold metal-dependent hydrolase
MVEVFSLAQRRGAPVLVHMRARGGTNYGAEDARLFLDKVLPASPDVEVVVAHFGGAGPGYPPQADEVMGVFAAAAKSNDKRLRNIYFDMATVVTAEATPADGELVAKRIREVGVGRILYGSDLNPPGGGIREGWEIFAAKVPLTPSELRTIAANRAPFTR